MEDKKDIRRAKITLTALAAIETCLFFYLVSLYGVSINPDSSYYISVARNVASGDGFIGYNNEPFVLQAPLYPIILALIKIAFSIDPLNSAGFINAILMGLITYFSGLFLLKRLNSFLFAILGTTAIVVSFVLVKFSLYALSEPLFILLVILYLYYIDNYLLRSDKNSLILFSTFAALICLTRYIGIVIILSGIITILVWKKSIFKEKFHHSVIFVSIAALPISLWLIRNYYISNTFFGQRSVSSYTLSENLKFFFDTIFNWFVNVRIHNEYLIPIFLIGTVLAIGGIIILSKLNKQVVNLTVVYPILVFVFLYSLAIIISSTTTAYDHISDRLLSPIYVPVIFVLFYMIDKIPTLWRLCRNFLSTYFTQRVMTIFLAVIVVIWIYYQANNTISIIGNYAQKSGLEFGSKAWGNSGVIHILRNMTIDEKYELYSNAPDAVYILANKEARWSPGKTYYNSPALVNPNSTSPVWKEKGKAYLIWFNKVNRKFLFSVKELKKSIDMIKINEAEDGRIYMIDIK